VQAHWHLHCPQEQVTHWQPAPQFAFAMIFEVVSLELFMVFFPLFV